MQQWVGLGRIGNMEEKEPTRSGDTMMTFSLALEEYNASKGERETTWLNVICFGRTADFVLEYFDVGEPIFVSSGRVSVNQWEDNAGNKRKGYDIIANRVEFVPSAKNGGGRRSTREEDEEEEEWEDVDDDDIWDIDEDENPFSDQ